MEKTKTQQLSMKLHQNGIVPQPQNNSTPQLQEVGAKNQRKKAPDDSPIQFKSVEWRSRSRIGRTDRGGNEARRRRLKQRSIYERINPSVVDHSPYISRIQDWQIGELRSEYHVRRFTARETRSGIWRENPGKVKKKQRKWETIHETLKKGESVKREKRVRLYTLREHKWPWLMQN